MRARWHLLAVVALFFCAVAVQAGRGASDGSLRDCADCPEMVVLPAGSFTMGSSESEAGRGKDEGPQHAVTISRSFAVGKYEVTFAEWDACVAAGGCTRYQPPDNGWGRRDRPVVYVSWDDAQGYASWLGRKTGKMYRLLSEAEWEYAARAGTATQRYWGDDVGRGNANCGGCDTLWDNKQTAPVGQFAPNAFGLHDMIGNVWEWVEDCYHDNYVGAAANGDAWTGGNCVGRVVRGSSWSLFPGDSRVADRDWFEPHIRYNFLGFRVAKTL